MSNSIKFGEQIPDIWREAETDKYLETLEEEKEPFDAYNDIGHEE